MDKTLAEIYGTNQPEGTDVEKLASAELGNQLAAEGEIDLNNLTDEDVEGLAAQVLASEGGEQPAATAGDPEAAAQEKVAEADMLGRVMAHSYVQELRSIEADKTKTAGKIGWAATVGAAKGREVAGKVGAHLAKHGKKYSAGAGAAGGAAAGAAAHKAMEKKSSALDTLAERLAVEICEANNIDPTKLTLVEQPQVEKTSAPAAEVLNAAVQERAVALLAQYGVQVQVEDAPTE